jgi:hypothetical protein
VRGARPCAHSAGRGLVALTQAGFVAPPRPRKKAETLEFSVKTKSKAVKTCCASGGLDSSTILRGPVAQDTQKRCAAVRAITWKWS